MENTILICKSNEGYTQKRFFVIRGVLICRCTSGILNLHTLKRILDFVSAVHMRYPHTKVPIHIELGDIKAVDKLSITLLECIAYSLIQDFGHPLTMDFNFSHTIWTEGVQFSPLVCLGRGVKNKKEQFIKGFLKDIQKTHFRALIPAIAVENGDLSILMGDVKNFLKYCFIGHTYCEALAEVIAEVVGNACEHNRTNCLMDIDITRKDYAKRGDNDNNYYGVNISIISFTTEVFGEALREKVAQHDNVDERYQLVKVAYANHTKWFSRDYSSRDFFRIAAFQDKISGRENEYKSGGTGLTKLLKSLEEMADADNCYLLSGERKINLLQSFLDYDSNGWVGFNKQNDFEHFPPDWSILDKSPINMPGVAYNLNFVCKQEDEQ